MHLKKIKRTIIKILGVKKVLAASHFLHHPFSGKPPSLTSQATQLSCTPFYIIGAGRSGSTLLRAMLCSHPHIAIPPEFYAMRETIRFYHKNANQPWPIFIDQFLSFLNQTEDFETWQIDLQNLKVKLLKLKKTERGLDNILDQLYILYGAIHFPGTKKWGDKTPLNTKNEDWIKLIFPEAKFIYMHRDGKDVALSLYKAGLVKNIEEGARRWLDYINYGQGFQKGRNFLEVHYEDLVTNPEVELKRICLFLGLSFEQKMLHFQEVFHKMGDTVKHAHHAAVGQKLSTDGIGRARRELSREELQKLEKILKNHKR